MPLSTTITKKAYQLKMRDANKDHGLFTEYKEIKPHWKVRIEKQQYPTTITFLIGSKPVKHIALGYKKIDWPSIPLKYREILGKPNGPFYYAIQCLENTEGLRELIVKMEGAYI